MSSRTVSRYLGPRIPGAWPQDTNRDGKHQREASPTEKVIYTVKLCEKILEHLTCIDLARARRVCHLFNAVINHSVAMQQNLFIRPR